MEEVLDNATRELRKVDHLIFVSLKYTRTVDVLKHIIKRHIESFDFMMDALYMDLKKRKKVKEKPITPGERVNELKKIFKKDDTIQELLLFYQNLRNLDRASYTKSREFRRHVTMTAQVGDGIQEITIDKVNEFYEISKKYLDYVKELLHMKND